ncbi:MAG: xanthine dehydrogenase family protein subunit M [Ramlibacter sp.]
MKPAPFAYHRPASLQEALALLEQLAPDAKVLAGGQSLAPMLNMRLARPAHLVDINDLAEYGRIVERDDAIEVGALARHAQVAASPLLAAHCPLLPRMARTIAHHAIREQGTLGGSLAHADPAAQLALAAVTLDATLVLVRQGSRREVRARDFLTGAMATVLDPTELLLAARFPVAQPGETCAFRLFNRRHGDYAIVAVAATVQMHQGRVQKLRLGIAGAGSLPVRLDAIERVQQGQPAGEDWVRAVATAVTGSLVIEDDGRIEPEYRRELVHAMVGRVLTRALERQEAMA